MSLSLVLLLGMKTNFFVMLQTSYQVDLRPETWYMVRITAHNEAGSTECVLQFATRGYSGSESILRIQKK